MADYDGDVSRATDPLSVFLPDPLAQFRRLIECEVEKSCAFRGPIRGRDRSLSRLIDQIAALEVAVPRKPAA